MKKYRFDNAHEQIFILNEDGDAYLYHGSYFIYGITKNMSEKKKISKIEGNYSLYNKRIIYKRNCPNQSF